MVGIDLLLLIAAILVIISILIAKIFHNIDIPTMLLFIGVGIVAGSEGIGGLEFADYDLARSIGIIALIFILFSGGLDTDWNSSRKVLFPSIILSTVGVLITSLIIGLFVMLLFDSSLIWGILVGAIISSTDAAAVFSIISNRNIGLKGRLKPLLEFESGSNDPMAVFLTIGMIELIIHPEKSFWEIILLFVIQMGLGGILGIIGGRLLGIIINKINLFYEGLYPIFTLAFILFIYSLTAVFQGSGFLAIYLAGIVLGNMDFVHKRSLKRFFDGFSVLSHITMFLTLGLLLFPSDLLEVAGIGLLLSLIIILLARPLAVFLTLFPFGFSTKEKLFVSWVGLKGAVPIILATFPLLLGITNSYLIFDIVFFIVISSSLLQGTTLKYFAKKLGLIEPQKSKIKIPLEFNSDKKSDTDLLEIIVPDNSSANGKQIVDLNFSNECRILLIVREDKNIVPVGNTIIYSGDLLLILANKKSGKGIEEILKPQ